MHHIASNLADFLIFNKIAERELREEYIYGLEVLSGKILNYGTLLILAWFNHNFVLTLLFMLSFFSLRSRTGGYHCKSPFHCYLGTILIYVSVTYSAAPVLSMNTYLTVFLVILSGLIIYFYSPVNHPSLNLDEEEIKMCRSASRWLALLIAVCVFAAAWLEIFPHCTAYIAAGMGADAGLLLAAKLLKQEVKTV